MTRFLAACGLLVAYLAVGSPGGTVSPVQAQAAPSVQAFEEGNQHYAAGAYALALDAYERALEAGYASGALYYNMGNAHFRQDALGEAIRYYEKARRLMPDSPELLHNLEIARSSTLDTFSRVPVPFWVRGWRYLVAAVPAYGFFIPGMLAYLLALALVAHRIWTRTRSAWHRRALTLSAVLAVGLLVLAFSSSAERAQQHEAVLLDAQQPLRTSPEAEASAELTIHEGLVVQVLRRSDQWTEVRLPNGVTGWVESNALGMI